MIVLRLKEFGEVKRANKAKKNEWRLRQRIRDSRVIDEENYRLQRMADELNSKKKWYQGKFKPEPVTEDEVLIKVKDGQRAVQEKMHFQDRVRKKKNAFRHGETIPGSEDLFMKTKRFKDLGEHVDPSKIEYITNDVHGVVNSNMNGSKYRARKLGLHSSETEHISGAEAQRRILERKKRAKSPINQIKSKITQTQEKATEAIKDQTKKRGFKLSRNQKIGAAALGTAALVGAGTYAYKKHKKSKENKD